MGFCDSNKDVWKPGTMLNPVPAVMVSCGDENESNIITIAWAGVVCSEPAMVSISVRPERYSYKMIEESGEFVINLVTEDLAFAADYCGVRSGSKTNKWKDCRLSAEKANKVKAPLIKESPVNIECKVVNKLELGSHHMFIGKIEAVNVDKKYMDKKGKFDLDACKLIAYSHGEYIKLGKVLGKFGFSVRKKR